MDQPIRFRRLGVTLVELLVVISIMLFLTAIAVPTMKPAMENRQIRDTARAINVFLASARVRAMEAGQPVGILIRRARNNDSRSEANSTLAMETSNLHAGTILEHIELPPPYSGETRNAQMVLSRGFIDQNSNGAWDPGEPFTNVFHVMQYNPIPNVIADVIAPHMVRPGDLIQFNYQGAWYTIGQPEGSGSLDTLGFFDINPSGTPAHQFQATMTISWPLGYTPPWTAQASLPMPFTILRQPDITPSQDRLFANRGAVAPLRLPPSVCVDLQCSGTMSRPLLLSAMDINTAVVGVQSPDPVLVFSPNGSLARLYAHGTGMLLTEPLYLMVGRRDRVFDRPVGPGQDGVSGSLDDHPAIDPNPIMPDDRKPNWEDPNNLWAVIQAQSGIVKTADMGFVDLDETVEANWYTGVWNSRGLARQSETKGGN
jgi:type II secretory pathway pseudopilin PulG